ncbi:MAG: class IV adenylate cyclase [Candidatus Tectomicrobia bacterium]|nr:class IV adenylate cyclase [Candidatus Tectomicrobia bacterium]
MRNIELKAQYPDLSKAEQICQEIPSSLLGVDHQIDTYFRVSRGRLKLRESTLSGSQLIYYERDDRQDARESLYEIASVSQPAELKLLLSKALGVRATVAKRRKIYLYQYVRIHLDLVEGLGTFLEFEAVMSDDMKSEEGATQVDHLRERFQILPEWLLSSSYGDLLEERQNIDESEDLFDIDLKDFVV